MRKSLCILLFSLLLVSKLTAQPITRYNTFSYSVNEGLLQSTLVSLVIDKNNFCWISFPNGIQKFDGSNFTTIKTQAGLPDDKFVNLFRCNNGDILISHTKGISKYEIAENRFLQVYEQPDNLQKPAYFIGEDNSIVYFIDGSTTIIGLQSGNYKVAARVPTNLPPFNGNAENTPSFSDNIVDHKVGFWIKETLYLLDFIKQKIIYQSPPIANRSPFFLHLLPGLKTLYYKYSDNTSLQCWDFATAANKILKIERKLEDSHISRMNILTWENKTLLSINNRLYEIDSALRIIKSELVNFQNLPVTGSHAIADMVQDNFGNLYLRTISGGIRKIIQNNYPIKYYGALNNESQTVIGVLPDKKNNRILVGTNGSGLYIYDTLQRLTRHISTIPNGKNGFGVNSIIKIPGGGYLLFVVGEKKVWRLSADMTNISPSPIVFSDTNNSSVINYFANEIYHDDQGAVVQSMYYLYRSSFSPVSTYAHAITKEYTLARLWYKDMIITHANEKLIFLDGKSLKEIKTILFPNTGGVRCFEKDGDAILVGTNKGLFKLDGTGKILFHWNKENGLPDDCIYAIAKDENGNYWCSSNKGIFRIDKNNNILHLTKEDGLQENEFNTTVVAKTDDGELFFGGVNGVSSFFPASISSFTEKNNLLITRIRINDKDIENSKASWQVDKLKLNYDQNALSFDFVAMADNNPRQYIYQYRMTGIDKEWLQNSGLQTVRYSLPPGKYVFQLYASRSYDKNPKPMKEILIIIKPPFWKSWWFISGLIVLVLSLLTFAINQRSKRKYAKKLQQLENERELKQERERISKDLHDSLGAYANAVLYNTELLEKEKEEEKKKELIGDLKFASKDIITSLRETVWALKKETYTAEDCLVRIRNFIQPFAKYYSHIHFRVEGDAPAGMELHYTKALNLVRIMQEAISNSIKHASPENITVSSFLMANKWKLTIADDGKGFDYHSMKEQERGNGLNNIEHRAAESNFDLNIQTEEKKGTVITIIV